MKIISKIKVFGKFLYDELYSIGEGIASISEGYSGLTDMFDSCGRDRRRAIRDEFQRKMETNEALQKDAEMLRKDWEVVGQDLEKAIKEVEKENKDN